MYRQLLFFYFQVREKVNISEDNPSHASATIACFLVQEGANIYVQNNKGHTPLQLCQPDIAALITSFIGKQRYGRARLCQKPGIGHQVRSPLFLCASQTSPFKIRQVAGCVQHLQAWPDYFAYYYYYYSLLFLDSRL